MSYSINLDKDHIIIENITKEELDLDKTLNCGQAFRWTKDNDDNWVGVVNKRIWILRQYEDYIITNLDKTFKEDIIYYFNLDTEYTLEISKLELDEFARKSYDFSKGIHILRQELIETMITFLMSSCNTITNIRSIINKLCKKYGDSINTEWNGKVYTEYTFPSLEKLSKITEKEFRDINMGFRASYLVDMIKTLNNDKQIMQNLLKSNYSEALKVLCRFNGVGNKIANCICLFSLHHISAFPIDTHIKQIITKVYNGNINLSLYKTYAGIIQQYMFYYKAYNK